MCPHKMFDDPDGPCCDVEGPHETHVYWRGSHDSTEPTGHANG